MKNRGCVLPIIIALAALVAAADAFAQKSLRDERISLAFRDTPATTVLRTLGKSLGYEVALDEKMNAPLTIELDGVSPTTALNAVCESVGCRWQIQGKTLRIEKMQVVVMERPSFKVRADAVKKRPLTARPLKSRVLGGVVGPTRSVASVDEQMPMKVSWVGADAGVVFHLFALMLDAQEDVAPEVAERRVSMQVKPGTLRQALDAVCAKVACGWEISEKRDAGSVRTLRVMAR